MKTNWQKGDKFRLLDVSKILCGPHRKNGDVLTVEGILYGSDYPYSECGLVIEEHELPYIEKVTEEEVKSHAEVRAYFDELVRSEELLEQHGVHGGQHRQGWQSVQQTLNLLGIQIEGVNVK